MPRPAAKGKPTEQNRRDTHISYHGDNDKVKQYFNFKDFIGFKTIKDIRDHYKIGKELGKGTFGVVNEANHVKGNFRAAIKIIDKVKLKSNDVYFNLMQDELKVLQEAAHPHIMRIYELMEDEDNYYIVSEFLEGGELFDRIVSLRTFRESKASYVIYQILLALNYIHKKGIMHRDLKPENILLESSDVDNLNIKLSDFGFATYYGDNENL